MLKNDTLGKSYDSNKSIEDNLKNPMLVGVLMSLLVRLAPTIFGDVVG
jgi:hypothetical protein